MYTPASSVERIKTSGAETGDLCTVREGRVPPGTVGAGYLAILGEGTEPS